MNLCNSVKKYLPEFVGGELDGDFKKRIEGHLKTCTICQKEKALLEKSWALLERWPSVEPSPDFRSKFWKRVDARERQKRPVLSHPFIWRLAPVLAFVLFIITVSSIFIKSRMEQVSLAKNIELYQNLEVIQDIDFLINLEFLTEQNGYEG